MNFQGMEKLVGKSTYGEKDGKITFAEYVESIFESIKQNLRQRPCRDKDPDACDWSNAFKNSTLLYVKSKLVAEFRTLDINGDGIISKRDDVNKDGMVTLEDKHNYNALKTEKK